MKKRIRDIRVYDICPICKGGNLSTSDYEDYYCLNIKCPLEKMEFTKPLPILGEEND